MNVYTQLRYRNQPEFSSQNSLACPHCQGIGWRPVVLNGVRRFIRCHHERQVPGISSRDFKSAAAGER